MNTHRWINPVMMAFWLVIVLAAWFSFLPANIGGRTSYVILIGNSMAPDFNQGDLVLVREMNSYEIGEIVAYDHPNIGTVFHRIIQQVDDRFLLKGDNNNWIDSFEATPNEIIGKLWIHIPTIGFFLQYLRSPAIFSIFVTGLTIVFLITISSPKKKLTGDQNQNLLDLVKRVRHKVVSMEKNISEKIFAFAVVAFASLLLLINSFSASLERTVPDNVEFTHKGSIEYFATVPTGIYEGDILQSGDPIFRQVSDTVNIIFSYQLLSDQTAVVNGTLRLMAEISESSGWIRTIDITTQEDFSGSTYTTTGTLEFSQIQAITDYLEQQTEIFNNKYTLTIRPQVSIHGSIENRPLESNFAPGLAFSFQDQKLELLKETNSFQNSLSPQEIGIIPGTRVESNSISLLGIQINVLLARIFSVYLLIFAIGAFSWSGYQYFRLSRDQENDAAKEMDD